MKVLFLEVDTRAEWAVASIGPAFIASYLRAAGHEVEMFRVPPTLRPGAVAEEVESAAPDLLAFSLTSRQWLRARELASTLRRRKNRPTVAGGLHPTFSPESVLEAPGFDYVCLGEGEGATLDLVEALEAGREVEPGSIDNLWLPGGSRPRLRPPIGELDALPFMARDMLDEPRGVVHMATQRGCPYPCTYCAARNFDELYGSDYGRRRSHESVLGELERIAATGGLSYVIFLDDTFTIRRRWVERFCELYGTRFGVPFSLHARVETVDERLLEALAAAGCRHITYGVESGSFRVRRDVMRRPVTDERIRDVFRRTREAGIQVTANYMLGVPGETRDDLERTLELASELDVADFGFFVFYPYPGTHLYTLCRDRGYLPDDYLERPANHRESILDLPDLRREDIAEFYERFTALRESLYRRRYAGSAAAERAVMEHVRESAANG